MNSRLCLILLTLLSALSAMAQTHLAWQPVHPAETVCLTPEASRSIRNINLPKGTLGFLLKVTTDSQTPDTATSLFNSIKTQPAAEAQEMVNYLLSTGDGKQCDVLLFNEQRQANMFLNKQEGWLPCQVYRDVSTACYFTTQCRNALALGFRNNTATDTLYIRFELVALVDPSISLHLTSAFAQMYYSECLKSDSAYNFYKQQLPDYCGCIAEKVDKDYKHLMALQQQNPNDQSILQLALQCAQQLDSTPFITAAKQETLKQLLNLRNQNDPKALINFCLAQIKAGNDIQEIYNQLGWEYLTTKQFAKAKQYLSLGAAKYPANLYLQGNLAHALLLTGDYNAAMQIYRAHINENIDTNITWKAALVSDITYFQSLGIQNPHFNELISLGLK
ncbi:MAG: hypothetical protein U0T75_00780 [Chitinophagales bacterium]